MRALLACMLAVALAGPTTVYAQRLPSGGATVPVSWQPATNPATLTLDLDGDAQADVQFSYSTQQPTGPGTISTRLFTVSCYPATSALELAIDDTEYDSAHRYQAGDLLEGPVRWLRTSGYLDYVVMGNGGTGGRGFFRNNATGYVVLRKKMGNTAQYWWVYIGPRSQSTDNWVDYYGTSMVVLAATPTAGPVVAPAFPNPSAGGWQLPQPAAYQLFDNQGRLAGSSQAATASIEADGLAPGQYLLLLRLPDGSVARQQLIKH